MLGDVHCEERALAAALALFERERVDRVLAVGDLVDGPGDARRTLDLLRRGGVECVAGNHDRWLLAGALRELPDATPLAALDAVDRAWLAALPRTRTYATPRGALLLCHGLGDDDMATLGPDDAGYALDNNDALARLLARGEHRIVVSGHSHRRMVRRHAGVTFVNAGTLLRGHSPCALVLDLDALTATFSDWDGAAFGARALFSV